MFQKTDVAIVGAGVVGLAHAYHAAKAGFSVSVFERSEFSEGATVRNFGMLAIVAQQEGEQRDSALRSLKHWQAISKSCGISLQNNGCLFLAQEPEEMAVLEEFSLLDVGFAKKVKFVHADSLQNRLGNTVGENVLGGMWSPDAWKVDQREAPWKMVRWLADKHGVRFHFSTDVTGIKAGSLDTSKGRVSAKQILICTGNEFSVLFPVEFAKAEVEQCKLQMLRVRPKKQVALEPFVLGGLSLSRYNAFSSCATVVELKALQKTKYRKYVDYGIHLIAAQELDGSITIGDSHVYGRELDNKRIPEIDNLLLDYLSRLLNLSECAIEKHWLGFYAYHRELELLRISPRDNVEIVTLTNGQGMTHALSIAEDVIDEIQARF